MTNKTNNLETAIAIALEAHKGQPDKAGSPYILHCLRVMLKGETLNEQIVGVLHDTIEDTNVKAKDLQKAGFTEEIIDAIECLSKRENEDHKKYLSRVLSNKIAIKVKLNDLEDNLNLLRLKEIKESDIKRLNKYLETYRMLSGIDSNNIINKHSF